MTGVEEPSALQKKIEERKAKKSLKQALNKGNLNPNEEVEMKEDNAVEVNSNPLCKDSESSIEKVEPQKEEAGDGESGMSIDAALDVISIHTHLHYAFDNWMMKSSSAFQLIFVMTTVILVVGGIAMNLVSEDEELAPTVWEGMWVCWQYLNDASAHTELKGTVRVVGAIVSLLGLLVFAMLMGFVFDLITINMEELRKGKSHVVEKDHTLILGWSDKIFTILGELCAANETRPDGSCGGVIVILADQLPKDEMMAELEERFPEEDRLGSKFVLRTGSPMLASDLTKVATNQSRSIIILADADGEPEKADAAVLRTVVSLGACLTAACEAHIVSEIRDIDCTPLLNLVGNGRVETVVSHDIVGRLMVMSVRQPGLTDIYAQLLGFDGDEFYIEAWDDAIGVPFGELCQHFPDAIPLGIRTEDGTVVMKPSMMRPVAEGEEILVLSEDDDTYDWDMDLQSKKPKLYKPEVSVTPGPGPVAQSKTPEKMLMVGWRRDVRDIIQLVDQLVQPGSEVHIAATKDEDERAEALTDAGLDVSTLRNVTLVHHVGYARRHFEKLPLEQFDSVIIVADEEAEEDLMNSDSICIQTLLMIRDVQMTRKEMVKEDCDEQLKMQKSCPVLVETLDPRTQDCILRSDALQAVADFVQSNEMVSRVLAMVSEERSVNTILEELLGGSGAGLELRAATEYLNEHTEQLTFMQLAKRAQEVDHILLGYQTRCGITYETFMNPRDKLVPKVWNNMKLVVMTGSPMFPDLHEGTERTLPVPTMGVGALAGIQIPTTAGSTYDDFL